MPTIEELLELAADLERFAPGDDALGALIDRVGDDELAIDDLDQIAAATRVPYSILQELWRQIAD